MTPLATKLLSKYCAHIRGGAADANLIAFAQDLATAKCFETTEVFGLARELTQKMSEEHGPENLIIMRDIEYAFLPFDRTWIEFLGTKNRYGILKFLPVRACAPGLKYLLDINPMAECEQGKKQERIVGGRALHYCRTHLRLYKGRLVRVQAHWRGDPALGVVRADYRVV